MEKIMNLNFRSFYGLTMFFFFFGWLIMLASSAGLFYRETAALSIAISAILALFIAKKIPEKSDVEKNDYKRILAVILISAAVSITTCRFATPSVLGGRDQGAIATASINLAKNHQLKFENPLSRDLFQKYGSGKALNYPGFNYTKDGQLLSRFPVAFTSYLAAIYELFGLKGVQYANLPFLLLFLISFWLILRIFFSRSVSFLGFLIAASFFPFIWFAKYTLTETYMLFLVWTSLFFFLKFLKDRSSIFLYLSLLGFTLASLCRIEGIVFLALAILYIALRGRKDSSLLPIKIKYIYLGFIVALALYFYLNFPALSDSLKNIAKVFLPSASQNSAGSPSSYKNMLILFLNYNFLAYAIVGIFGLGYLLTGLRKNLLKSKIAIFFILFPSLIYLILPLISLDDPWMFRRYSFAVFPMLIFYTIFALNKFFYHRILLYFCLIVMALVNGFVSFRYIQLSENQNLLPQIEKISHNFEPNDLILVDRLATGNGWSLISEPLNSLYGKQAIYFFNTDDLKAIDESRYKNIYLVAPFADDSAWYSNLVKDKHPISSFLIENNFLESSEGFLKLSIDIQSKMFDGIWKIK